MNYHEIEDFDLWEESHTCVSAVSLYVLSHLKTNHNLDKVYERLKQYILKSQSNSLWTSYWWTSPFYATSFIIKAAFKNADTDLQLACVSAIKAINQAQNRDGSFGDRFLPESAFYTGLVSESLCSSKSCIQTTELQ